MEPSKDKKDLTPEEQAKLEASRLARKQAALDAKAAKIAKASAKAEQAAKWKTPTNTDDKKEKKKKTNTKAAEEEQEVLITPKGEKKLLHKKLAATYDVKSVEASWYDWWVQSNFFSPDYVRPGMTQEEHDALERFSIVIPPPNVTGVLHIGHALTNSVQDTIVRFHRMHRKRVLWVPGMDHAGIATQAVVEKKLARESGQTKTDLGREKFVDLIYKWKDEHGGKIQEQQKRMGISVDWNRAVFTMDKGHSEAVIEAFVRFYEKKIIYRANRLVNWSCRLRTCISDVECDDWEIDDKSGREFAVVGHDKDKLYPFGFLWSIAYKVEDSDEEIVIATTRPETLLGDTGIAVHPDDERYKHLHGKFFKHPFVNRRIPLVLDSTLVKMEFGTGAVKVTPAHDPNDYDCGNRKNLEFINIFNEDGSMNSNCGEFEGMMRFDARIKIIERLEELGLYKGKKKNNMVLKKCSRSGDIIEPILKPQWWANMDGLAKRAVDLFNENKFSILPTSYHQFWFNFMENARPWCISRQLWWGHRVPAYLAWPKGSPKPDSGAAESWIIARTPEEAREKAKALLNTDDFEIEQDSDVLDTWFSSGIFPFSVMGWPNANAEDYKKYYPNNFLETGYDILFFWVARMIMMGLELTDQLPFTDVFLHTLVRDQKGTKMSKSLGNVIDPLHVIEGISLQGLHDSVKAGNLPVEQLEKAYALQKEYFPEGIKECGTDALRFSLLTYMSAKSINLDTKRIEGYRHFCNKIWNAIKLTMMFLEPNYAPNQTSELTGHENPIDIWLLSRLHTCIISMEEAFKELDFGKLTNLIYMFWLYDFCDIYLEAAKPTLFFKGEITEEIKNAQIGHRATLYTAVDFALKALHPIMPYITEELWQYLPRRPSDETPSLCVADFPKPQEIHFNETITAEFETIQQIYKAARVLCATYNIVKKGVTKATINAHNEKAKANIEKFKNVIVTLAYLQDVNVVFQQGIPSGCAAQQIDESTDLYLHLEGVDLEKEIKRMEGRKTTLSTSIKDLSSKIASPDYQFVPSHIQEQNSEKLQGFEVELQNVTQALVTLQAMLQVKKSSS